MAFNQLPDSNWELTKICKLKQSAGPVCHINTNRPIFFIKKLPIFTIIYVQGKCGATYHVKYTLDIFFWYIGKKRLYISSLFVGRSSMIDQKLNLSKNWVCDLINNKGKKFTRPGYTIKRNTREH